MIIEGNVIIADDGKVLTNGETYSKKVFLGVRDTPENWQEIPEPDIPEEPTTEDKAEAYDILTGVNA